MEIVWAVVVNPSTEMEQVIGKFVHDLSGNLRE